eukprot:scaffold67603_cov16-Prasinocladus_malaysianus.AAC.1
MAARYVTIEIDTFRHRRHNVDNDLNNQQLASGMGIIRLFSSLVSLHRTSSRAECTLADVCTGVLVTSH